MENVLRSLNVIENEFLISHAVLSFVNDGKVFGVVRASEESVGTFDSCFVRKVASALRHHFAGEADLNFLYAGERYDSESGGFHLIYTDGSAVDGDVEIVVRADLVEVF